MSNIEAIRESLSAVLDGEGSDLDLARVLKAVDDPDVRDQVREDWQRQTMTSHLLRGDRTGPASIDISRGVRTAIEAQPQRQANPLVGLAVAASVTLAVVFGGQQMLSSQVPAPIGNLPGGVVAVQGASAQQASARSGLNTSVPATVRAPVNRVLVSPTPASADSNYYNQLALERYQQLGAEHASASAILQPSVLVPYARVPESKR